MRRQFIKRFNDCRTLLELNRASQLLSNQLTDGKIRTFRRGYQLITLDTRLYDREKSKRKRCCKKTATKILVPIERKTESICHHPDGEMASLQ